MNLDPEHSSIQNSFYRPSHLVSANNELSSSYDKAIEFKLVLLNRHFQTKLNKVKSNHTIYQHYRNPLQSPALYVHYHSINVI